MMATVLAYIFTSALVWSLAHGKMLEEGTTRSIFLPSEPDPYRDSYLTTVTRMSMHEILALPKLTDSELLDQLVHGYNSFPVSRRGQNSSNLFDSSFDDVLEETPYIENEWEELMDAGPRSIILMGSIMAVASIKDFALSSNFNYQLIKNPKSFSATLMQTAHSMHDALYNAHTDMERVHVNMKSIPNMLKEAIKIITQGSVSLSQIMLPGTLQRISRSANESAIVARASLDRFESLQLLLQEVLTVVTLTNSEYKSTANEIAKETSKFQNEKNGLDQMVSNIRAEYDSARQNLERARRVYHTAMSQVPSNQWDSSAWNVYASQRPAETCWRTWYKKRKCRSLRDEQFKEYTAVARLKAEQTLAALRASETSSTNIYNHQINKQNELQAVIDKLAKLNLRELSTNETIQMLLDATKKTSLLHAQWSRLCRFFTTLAIGTEYTLKVVMENFLSAISDVQLLGTTLDPEDATLFTVLLVESAIDIERDAHLFYLMAKTYSDVSSKYMISQISGLSGTLSLQTNDERSTYIKQMAHESQIVSNQVKALTNKRHIEYEMANIDRQNQYRQFIREGELQETMNNSNHVGIGRR